MSYFILRTEKRLCLPHRGHGPCHDGRYRRCGYRRVVRVGDLPLRLHRFADACRASEARFGVGPHTISVPRLCPADDIDTADFKNCVPDEIFHKIVAVLRIAVPYTGMIVSTRETPASREKVLELGVSQLSGGSRTSVGGYVQEETEENSAQFDVSDRRSLDEVVGWLLDLGLLPSFCTACYREGRTGDRFMSLVKKGQIANCCLPNALLTLKEYLNDYASPATRAKGEAMRLPVCWKPCPADGFGRMPAAI